MTRRMPIVIVAIAVSTAGWAGVGVNAAHAVSSRRVLAGSTFAWARTSAAVGLPARDRALSLRVYLSSRDQAGLDAAVKAVTTPGNPAFRHFITSAQFAARFSPSTGEVAAVSQWLRSARLSVTGVGAGRRYVAARGSVAAAELAFATTLRTYRHDGRNVMAPSTDASAPADVAGSVLGVTGLDDLPHYATTGLAGNPGPPAASLRATPCSQWYGQLTATTARDGSPLPPFKGSARPWTTCGYLPQQLRAAYGADTTKLTGKGVTVGIGLWYASATQPADENRFDQAHGWPAFAPGQYQQVLPSAYKKSTVCGSAEDEQSIDITAIHDIAPAANVVYYSAASCFDPDLLDMFARVVDDDDVSVLDNSWGGLLSRTTTSSIDAYEQIFKQAALQGQAIFFSSGDDGDWTAVRHRTDYDYPASDPLVTSVGGTTLNVGSTDNYVWEAGWGYSIRTLHDGAWVDPQFGGGAGGGFAPLWGRPDYEAGVVRSRTDGRAYPDIAADADNMTGIRVGYRQQFPAGPQYAETRWGGTSLSSPLMVGEEALAEQSLGGRAGFANPLIYGLARAHSSALTDITDAHDSEALVRVDYVNGFNGKAGFTYTLRSVDDDSSLHTNVGWDDVTGVGTPTAGYPAAIAAAAQASAPHESRK